jgi:hypothetical protein
MENIFKVVQCYINGYNNKEKTLENIKNLNFETTFNNSFLISYIYSNSRDLSFFSKLLDKDNNDIEAINLAIYLGRNGANLEFLKNFLQKRKFNLSINLQNIFTSFFNNENNEFLVKILKDIYNGKKLEDILLLDENFKEFRLELYSYKKNLFDNILSYKEIFDKKEPIKWLPTNNRKTPEFYADYGKETNELIKFIHNPLFCDYTYSETTKLLKISSFEEYVNNNPNMLGLRAILTSIIRRERLGVGTLSRSIADGLVSLLLEKMKEKFSIENI